MARSRRIGILPEEETFPASTPSSRVSSINRRPWVMKCSVFAVDGKVSPICSRALNSIRIHSALNYGNTRVIDRTGGTMLHTSRVNPRKMRASSVPKHISAERLAPLEVADGIFNFTPVVVDNIAHLGLDYLIPIGGDDTLSFAGVLDAQGVQLIGIPKTMDNDVQGTEYCIGFSTAITRGREAINRQRTILGSHERIGIFRMFGRDAGFTALYSAYVTGGRCVIPEIEFDLQHLIDLLLEDKGNNSSRYAFVIASEGALWQGQSLSEWGEADAYGHKKKADIGLALAEEIHRHTGQDTISSDLTYELRGGEPDVLDYIAANTFGILPWI